MSGVVSSFLSQHLTDEQSKTNREKSSAPSEAVAQVTRETGFLTSDWVFPSSQTKNSKTQI